MAFIGRCDELETLLNFYRQDINNLAIVYGRRRIGKSELIRHSLQKEGCRFIYHECKQTSEINNVQSLMELAARQSGTPPFAVESFEKALDLLFCYAKS